MGLLDKLRLAGRKKESQAEPLIYQEYEGQYGVMVPEDYEHYAKGYGAITWIYACTYAISHNIAGVPIITTDMQGTPRQGSRLANLIARPNPWQTGTDLIQGTLTYLELVGNAYWELVRDGTGKVAQMYLLRPDRMKIVPDPHEKIKGYLYELRGKKVAFDPEEILHMKYFNPWDDYYGQGSLTAALQPTILETYAITYNKALFQNGAVPGGVLEAEGKPGPDTIERLRKEFDKRHKGVTKSGRTAILTEGLKWKEIARSLADMQYKELRKMNREEILASFGVPPVMVGIFEYANYANSMEQKKMMWEETLIPKIGLLEDSINIRLAPYVEPAVKIKFDLSDVPALQMNWEQEANVGERLTKNGLMTINEWREKNGLEPVPWGDVWWKSFYLVPISSGLLVPGTTPAGMLSLDQASGNFSIPGGAIIPALPPAEKAKAEPSRNDLNPVVDRLARKLKRLFQDQQIEVLRAIREGKWRWQDGILVKLPSRANPPFDAEMWAERFADALEPELGAAMKIGAGAGAHMAGITTPAFDIQSTEAANAVQNLSRLFCDEIQQHTVDAIMDAVEDSIVAGETVGQLTDRINGIYDYAKTGRAEMAARTETSRAYTEGQIFEWREAGIEKKQWHAIFVNTCDDCAAMNGKVIELEGKYAGLKDDVLNGPPLHPNCMCDLYPVI